jgi:hypothetical protein
MLLLDALESERDEIATRTVSVGVLITH